MTLWVIGVLFTWGLCIVDEEDDIPWYQELGMSLVLIALWPIFLGVLVGHKLKGKPDA